MPSFVSNMIEFASGFAVLQSTTLAVMGMVSLLYMYRRICSPSYSNKGLNSGEVCAGRIDVFPVHGKDEETRQF